MTQKNGAPKRSIPDGPHKTVRIGCTDRGGHRVERFGSAWVWPDGTISLRARDPRDGVIVAQGGLPTWADFVCPQCPRRPEINADRISRALIGLAALGVGRLDISLLD